LKDRSNSKDKPLLKNRNLTISIFYCFKIFNLYFKELEKVNGSLKKQIEEISNGEDEKPIYIEKRIVRDRIVRRYGNFFSDGGPANGLQIFQTESGRFVYLSMEGDIKYLEEELLHKLHKLL
jgi:hypothetical protein